MCGIAGYLGPCSADLEKLSGAFDRLLAHRGPDDSGREILDVKDPPGRALLLAHRRLSIIDLSPLGHQPMGDSATGNRIVYNGEIYNYRELRRDLASQDVEFTSQSDTEVILKGYRRKGPGILSDLKGMFAFSLWDEDKEELLLAVDPLGIKPLYYWTGPGGQFMFASEVRALLDTGLVSRKVDPASLESYLSYGAVQAAPTFIRDVKSLLPGHCLVVSADGRLSGPRPYWSPPFAPEAENPPVPDNLEGRILELLEEVVHQHLVSDVPVGAFLSGGIDSTAIAALVSKQGIDLRTFSVVFTEEEYSEAPYSREIAKSLRLEHTELCLSENDLVSRLPMALDAMDQPTLDGINVYIISQAVRETGIKVVLSGQGGDEMFAGYPTFRDASRLCGWRRRLSFIPSPVWKLTGSLWNAVQSRRRVIPDKFGQFLSGDGSPYAALLLLRQVFPPSVRRELFPAGGAGTSPDGMPLAEAEELRRASAPLGDVNQVSLMELRTYLANMLLRDGDFMSMAHGLEVRVPFLDCRVVDFVARIPGGMKVDRSLPKPLLLKSLGDLIPPAAYGHPKQGFTFPWEKWLRQQLRGMTEEALTDAETFRGLGMDPLAVRSLWEAFCAERRGISWSRIWALVVLREWSRRHRAAL
ncbi:MAG: asparagine synthase (glutamine-hydrolyzing) [Nitrospinota bacterium]|jgi:asparagine synthase (glutamine-hydrolysing)|nr:asparagine synthase (glutamine-hydrolyzing) [Nitrospinota bacterium]